MGKFDRVLLASDFDNTLVNTQAAIDNGTNMPELCARNREALEYFEANGGAFSVSTGRAAAAFAPFAAGIPLNAPCVIANGAGLYDFAENRYLYTCFLSDKIYTQIHDVLARFPTAGFEVYHDDRRVHAMHINNYIRTHQHFTRMPATEVSDFAEIDRPIVKVLFEEDTDELERIRDYILSLPWSGEYELVFSAPHLLEMTARGATKGDAVLKLAELLNVPRENIYCAGDHANDISMLRVAAIPFAPANCIEAVRTFGAQLVCDCADGAIADIIEILDRRY